MYYLKLYYKLLEWEWHDNPNMLSVFIHCLLKANRADNKWQGIQIKAGSFVTSYENLSKLTGLTVRQVRTALNKLKMTGELTHKTTSRYSIITINNWSSYQDNDKQIDKQMTNKRQTNDKQMTTIRECKNDKNVEEVEEVEEVEKIFNRYGNYQNVYLKKNHYTQFLNACLSNDLMNNIIEEYSINIERGKEKRFNIDYPEAHYLGLMAYLKQKKKNVLKMSKEEPQSHYKPA